MLDTEWNAPYAANKAFFDVLVYVLFVRMTFLSMTEFNLNMRIRFV